MVLDQTLLHPRLIRTGFGKGFDLKILQPLKQDILIFLNQYSLLFISLI